MGYSKAHYDFAAGKNPSDFAKTLGLKNLGISIYRFKRGEGFDFFHNHREQEEVYLCLSGTADLLTQDTVTERISLTAGDIVRVDPGTLRALGNQSSPEALVLIAGACPHAYPAGFGHHDVIADVLQVTGHGQTGFSFPQDALPNDAKNITPTTTDEEC